MLCCSAMNSISTIIISSGCSISSISSSSSSSNSSMVVVVDVEPELSDVVEVCQAWEDGLVVL